MNDQHAMHEPDPAGSAADDHGATDDGHGATDHGDGHGDGHGHGHGHGHGEGGHDATALGPIDVAAWGAGFLGIGVALVIALAFVMATGGVG